MARAATVVPEEAWPATSVEMVPVNELAPYLRNSRAHPPKQLRKIADAIKKYGFTVPILRDENGTLLTGHARLEAARKLGLEAIPCTTAVGWSEEKKRAYRILDNKMALDSTWDTDALMMELGDLAEAGFDLELTGFDETELAHLLGEKDPAQPKEDQKKPIPAICPHCGEPLT